MDNNDNNANRSKRGPFGNINNRQNVQGSNNMQGDNYKQGLKQNAARANVNNMMPDLNFSRNDVNQNNFARPNRPFNAQGNFTNNENQATNIYGAQRFRSLDGFNPQANNTQLYMQNKPEASNHNNARPNYRGSGPNNQQLSQKTRNNFGKNQTLGMRDFANKNSSFENNNSANNPYKPNNNMSSNLSEFNKQIEDVFKPNFIPTKSNTENTKNSINTESKQSGEIREKTNTEPNVSPFERPKENRTSTTYTEGVRDKNYGLKQEQQDMEEKSFIQEPKKRRRGQNNVQSVSQSERQAKELPTVKFDNKNQNAPIASDNSLWQAQAPINIQVQPTKTRHKEPKIPPFNYHEQQNSNQNYKAKKKFAWLNILISVLLALALLLVALFTIVPQSDTGILGKINQLKTSIISKFKPVEKLKIENFSAASETNGFVDDRFIFSLTTSKNVKNVRLLDENNNVLDTEVYTTKNEEVIIWTINYIANTSYKGIVKPQVLDNDGQWIDGETSIILNVAKPSTEVPISATPYIPNTPEIEDADVESTQTPVPTEVPSPTPIATQTPEPTEEPTAIPTSTPEPTEEPEPTPEPTPTPLPTASAVPIQQVMASEKSSPEKLGLKTSIYVKNATVSDFNRNIPIAMPDSDYYKLWNGGVFTFRSDAYHQNASFGNVEKDNLNEKFETIWSFPVGGMKLKAETVYGFGYMSQPAIIKWFKEARDYMNLNEDKKQASGLTEVIYAAQDGNIYFLDIKDGKETRPIMKLGFPMKSAVSVYPSTNPIFGVGQSASFLGGGKQVEVGYRLYSLVDQKRLYFLDGRDKNAHYINGAFDGTALFDRLSDSMVVAGENGLLYTMALNTNFQHSKPSLSIAPSIEKYKSLAKGHNKKKVGIEAGVSMYGNYAYIVGGSGLLQCVDVNNMKPVWGFDLGDNTDASVAIDVNSDGSVYLYTGNTLVERTKGKSISLRKINALNGELIWEKNIDAKYNKKTITGLLASPIIGKNEIEDRVIFTVATDADAAKTIALSKEKGTQIWENSLSSYSCSSPIAIYGNEGQAWVIQGDSSGKLYLFDAASGEKKDEIQLEGAIESSPAAYKGNIIIGTSGDKSSSNIYCISLN